MGRYARISRPGLIYHVINRGNNKQAVFYEPEDYREYINTIQRYKKKYKFKLYAYCLMYNHVHLLIKITASGSISRIMQSITVAHTRRFNSKNKKCGHVWQGRFLSPIVSDDQYFLNAMKYIEQNPLRAKIVEKIDDYPWSSYRLNISKEKSVLINREENKIFNALGSSIDQRIVRYKSIVKECLDDEELERIRVSTNKGIDYISEQYREKVKTLLPGRMRGRPPGKLFNCL